MDQNFGQQQQSDPNASQTGNQLNDAGNNGNTDGAIQVGQNLVQHLIDVIKQAFGGGN